MTQKKYLTVPNGLSLSRLVFLPLLYVFALKDMRAAFVIGYAILGSTDFFDGQVARIFNQKTDFGKTFDSIADLPFYLSSAYFMARLYSEYLKPNMTLLYIFFGILGLSFIVSAIRCRKPILMHTFILKLCGVLVYFLLILSYFVNTTILVTVILGLYYIGFTEEIMIFIKYGEVDPDSHSLFKIRPKG